MRLRGVMRASDRGDFILYVFSPCIFTPRLTARVKHAPVRRGLYYLARDLDCGGLSHQFRSCIGTHARAGGKCKQIKQTRNTYVLYPLAKSALGNRPFWGSPKTPLGTGLFSVIYICLFNIKQNIRVYLIYLRFRLA